MAFIFHEDINVGTWLNGVVEVIMALDTRLTLGHELSILKFALEG